MADILLEDHLVGVEQQIVELVERRERARVQHRDTEVTQMDLELERLYDEMATTAAQIIDEHHDSPHISAPHAA
jgi:hypothetical protein